MIQALSRCVDILKHVAEKPDGIKIADLARIMDLKYTTVYNLIQSLIQEGLLEYDENEVLRLGKLVTTLHRRRFTTAGRQAVVEKMRGLNRNYQCSLTFSQYQNGKVIGRLNSNTSKGGFIHTSSGALEYFNTVSGVAHTAFLPVRERDILIKENQFDDKAVKRWGDYSTFEKAVRECRERGYALLPFEKMERVGVPLYCDGRFFGVLTISLTENNPEQWREALKDLSDLQELKLADFADDPYNLNEI